MRKIVSCTHCGVACVEALKRCSDVALGACGTGAAGLGDEGGRVVFSLPRSVYQHLSHSCIDLARVSFLVDGCLALPCLEVNVRTAEAEVETEQMCCVSCCIDFGILSYVSHAVRCQLLLGKYNVVIVARSTLFSGFVMFCGLVRLLSLLTLDPSAPE